MFICTFFCFRFDSGGTKDKLLFVGRRPILPAVRTVSRDFVTTIKVEQQQQHHQEQQQKRQEQERQPEEHQEMSRAKLQPDKGRGKQAVEEKQGEKGQGQKEQGEEEQSPFVQKQLRTGVRQLSEQTLQTEQAEQRQLKAQPREQLPVEEWQQGVQRPTEKPLVKQQSKKKLVADQRNAEQQSAETEKQAPAEQHQKPELAPAERQQKPELAPEQHREERHHTLGHRAAGQQRVRQRIVQEPKPTGEQQRSLLSGSAEEGATATGITVIVAPVPVDSVPHHEAVPPAENCSQQPKQPPSSSVSTAAAAQATADQDRRRQKREQFRGSNPELARTRSGASGGLGQAAVRYGSSLAVDRLTTTGGGGVRTAPLPLAARHSSPTPAAAGPVSTREKEMPGGKMKVKSPVVSTSRADITAGYVHNDEQETIAELCRSAAGNKSEGKAAATAEDRGALARITQDILEAMAQKPAHGGHYKELEDLLKVGRGFIGCLPVPPPPPSALGFSGLGIKLRVQY